MPLHKRTVENPYWRYKRSWVLLPFEVEQIKRKKKRRSELYAEMQPLTCRGLAEEYDVCKSTIDRCKEQKHHSIFLPFEVAAILRAKKRRDEIAAEIKPLTDAALAIEYDVSATTISRI